VPIVTDRVVWSVGLSVSLSHSKLCRTAEVIEMLFASAIGGPSETPVAYSEPLWVNTVLCLLNTIQPSGLEFTSSVSLSTVFLAINLLNSALDHM